MARKPARPRSTAEIRLEAARALVIAIGGQMAAHLQGFGPRWHRSGPDRERAVELAREWWDAVDTMKKRQAEVEGVEPK